MTQTYQHAPLSRKETYIIFLGKFLVSKELGVHASGAHILGSLGLLDAIGMGLLGVVVCAGVLLLWLQRIDKGQGRRNVR
jgi:hypothetical protein